MRRLVWLLPALALAALLFGTAGVALAAPNDGVVTGSVANGTSGGASPAGDTVYALIFGVKEQAPLDQKSTTVAADGTYRLEGLDRDPNLVYLLVVQHQGNSYSSPQPFQLKDQPSFTANVTVYDATTADSALQLDSLNVLVTGADPGVLHAMEMGSVTNTSDHTFVVGDPGDGAAARGLKFSLPKGAINAQLQAGFSQQDVIPAVGGIQVVTPVQPGSHQFAVSFDVPYTGSDVDMSVQAPYQTSAFSLYVPEGSFGLNSSSVQLTTKAQMGGQPYDQYGASNLARGTVISATIVGLPTPGGTGLSANQLALISLGAVVFALGAGMMVMTFRGARTGAAAALEPARPEEERLQLILKLAMLDERHARGDVPDAEYEAERTRGKQRLVELARTQPSVASPDFTLNPNPPEPVNAAGPAS